MSESTPPAGPDAAPGPAHDLSEPAAEASATKPVEPAATAPLEPAAREPLEPVATAPVEPVATAPLEFVPHDAPSRGGVVRLAGYLVAAVAGALLVLGGLAAAGGIALPTASPSPSPSPSASPAYMQGTALGDAAAPVTIEVWADYQCPYCALQARGVEPSIERTLVEPGKARLVFHDFAFLGQESIDAAVAAQCAGRQGAYWYYHDLLFSSQQGENQGAFARDRLLNLASFAGLDRASFTTCLDDKTVVAAVEAETKTGRGYGVSSTPTLRITGPGGSELLTGVKPLSEVEAAVERMSKPAPPASPTGSPGDSGGSPSSPASSSPASSSPASSSPAPSSAPSPAPSPSP